jgi:hypothetical protein
VLAKEDTNATTGDSGVEIVAKSRRAQQWMRSGQSSSWRREHEHYDEEAGEGVWLVMRVVDCKTILLSVVIVDDNQSAVLASASLTKEQADSASKILIVHR